MKAIFILLMLIFFPVTSIVLGIGATAFIYTYWWAILGFIVFCMILNYGRKVNEKENEEDRLKEEEARIQRAVTAALLAAKGEGK